MSNMAYCRFQNTQPDLQDCYNALCEGGLSNLSDEELRAAKNLIGICCDIAADFKDELNA